MPTINVMRQRPAQRSSPSSHSRGHLCSSSLVQPPTTISASRTCVLSFGPKIRTTAEIRGLLDRWPAGFSSAGTDCKETQAEEESASKKDTTAPVIAHGNEPPRGAKIYRELQQEGEDEELLRKKGDAMPEKKN
ncbi:hypothetical protein CONLIGDRAFT_687727 [Coniochaeta ligniaria NRRL 30616]|uniref:Uncharacterized protein n=1 Tax=Coniochaeta ligniaria NRRL 30616 TaxID=1408157 RepID=A0A1J7I4F3_9PEZI|nr:hypothetical protein CONLIGDRAFT_687727 [Coniochaeta ligniaria NRRL 30616]